MGIMDEIAYRVMRMRQRYPRQDDLVMAEVFQTDAFRQGSAASRCEVMHASSQWRYDYETSNQPFPKTLGIDPSRYLEGNVVLDLGCFTGGRGISWAETYGIRRLCGIDVDTVFTRSAHDFAGLKKVEAAYATAVAEELPFEDRVFDTIVCWDVLEHVRDYGKVLRECWRVLKPGGHAILIFPPYYSPREHHLVDASVVPFLTCLFSGRTLTRAYDRIIAERGEGHRWYRRASPELEPWERSHLLNGITVSAFWRAVRAGSWTVVRKCHRPLLGSRGGMWLPAVWLSRALARVPILSEVFTRRVICILRKDAP